MTKMLEMICTIPDPIGWMLVGSLGTLCAIMGWKVGKLIYIAIKERLEDDEEECEE
jgi:hypothetical protein